MDNQSSSERKNPPDWDEMSTDEEILTSRPNWDMGVQDQREEDLLRSPSPPPYSPLTPEQAAPVEDVEMEGLDVPPEPIPEMGTAPQSLGPLAVPYTPYLMRVQTRVFVARRAIVDIKGVERRTNWVPTDWRDDVSGPTPGMCPAGEMPRLPFSPICFPDDTTEEEQEEPPHDFEPPMEEYEIADEWENNFPPPVEQEIVEYLPESDIPVVTLSDDSIVEEPLPSTAGGHLEPPHQSPINVDENLADVGLDSNQMRRDTVDEDPNMQIDDEAREREEQMTLSAEAAERRRLVIPTPSDLDNEETLRQQALDTRSQQGARDLGGQDRSQQPFLRRPHTRSPPLVRPEEGNRDPDRSRSPEGTKRTETDGRDLRRDVVDGDGTPKPIPTLFSRPSRIEPPIRPKKKTHRGKRDGARRNRKAKQTPVMEGSSSDEQEAALTSLQRRLEAARAITPQHDSDSDADVSTSSTGRMKSLVMRPITDGIAPPGTCYQCYCVGHQYPDCPYEREWDFCYRCGYRNHTIATCPNCGKDYRRGLDERFGELRRQRKLR